MWFQDTSWTGLGTPKCPVRIREEVVGRGKSEQLCIDCSCCYLDPDNHQEMDGWKIMGFS